MLRHFDISEMSFACPSSVTDVCAPPHFSAAAKSIARDRKHSSVVERRSLLSCSPTVSIVYSTLSLSIENEVAFQSFACHFSVLFKRVCASRANITCHAKNGRASCQYRCSYKRGGNLCKVRTLSNCLCSQGIRSGHAPRKRTVRGDVMLVMFFFL